MTLATCTHHWRIAMPDGPTSSGRCRKCGARREFISSNDEAPVKSRAGQACDECGVVKAKTHGTFKFDGALKRWGKTCKLCLDKGA